MYMMERKKKKKLPKLENWVQNIMPVYTDQQFKLYFRISRGTFEYLLTLIAPRLKRAYLGRPMTSPEKQLLIATWRITTNECYSSISKKFKVGRATALQSTQRVLDVLFDLATTFIRWPTGSQVTENYTGFEAISGFPQIIGIIDCTYINIPLPHVKAASYINSMGRHSVKLQAICNHKAQFIHCATGYPGSMHNQQVFQSSELQEWLEDPGKFPDDCHLLGSAAYKLHKNIMVPYNGYNGYLTPGQRNFNLCHSSTGIAIKRAFRLLKTRFQSIKTILAMDRFDLMPKFIIACCAMHNICVSRGDEIDFDEINETADNSFYIDIVPEQAGVAKRDSISERLPMHNIWCTL